MQILGSWCCKGAKSGKLCNSVGGVAKDVATGRQLPHELKVIFSFMGSSKRVYGPDAILGLKSDMVYGPNFKLPQP